MCSSRWPWLEPTSAETVEGTSLTLPLDRAPDGLQLYTMPGLFPFWKHTPKGTSLAFFSSNHSVLLCLTSFPSFLSGGEILLIFEETGLPVLPSETHEEGQITLAELIRLCSLFASPTGHYPLSVIQLLTNLGGFPLQLVSAFPKWGNIRGGHRLRTDCFSRDLFCIWTAHVYLMNKYKQHLHAAV